MAWPSRKTGSPYEEVIARLGQEHEKRHLATFAEFVDLSGGDLAEREDQTKAEVERGSPVIYQGVLRATVDIAGSECEIVGRPDFPIRMDDGYGIRDSKMARRIMSWLAVQVESNEASLC